MAAWGEGNSAFAVTSRSGPLQRHGHTSLSSSITRCTRSRFGRLEGFLARTDRSSLRFPEGFLDAVRLHLKVMERRSAA